MSLTAWQRLKRKLEQEPAQERDRNVLLVAFGDSVTQGLFVNPGLVGNDVYHEVFRRTLVARYPERTFSGVNAGISGNDTAGGLARLPHDVLDHHPDLVLVCFGLNDAWGGAAGEESFRTNLTKIVRQIEAEAAVILLTPNMMITRDNELTLPQYKSQIQAFIDMQRGGGLSRYVQVIRDVARATGTPLADAYAEWIRRDAAGEDLSAHLCINHPDPYGHGILAEAVGGAFAAAVGARAVWS